MAVTPGDCIKRIQDAAGRDLTDDEVSDVFERINKAKNDIAAGRIKGVEGKAIDMGKNLAGRLNADMLGTNGDQLAKTGAEAIQEAAQWAAAEKVHEADLKVRRAELQVLATESTAKRITEMRRGHGGFTQSQALSRDMNNQLQYIQTIRTSAISRLTDLLDAVTDKTGVGPLRNLAMRLFDVDNPAMTRDIVREVFAKADGHTGNVASKKAAAAWLQTIEALRVRFNNAGGDIGKLGYGYLTQVHDAVKIYQAGAEGWVQAVAPLLDRTQYVDHDGNLMGDKQYLELLNQVHETLASGGLNKIEPGQYRGAGMRANSGSDARVLHFKDGAAWLAYMHQFGQGSLYDAMTGHLSHMARNIGLVEKYGPNPEMQFALQYDLAKREDAPHGKGMGEAKASRYWGNTPQAYWDILSGKTGTPENATLAQIGQGARNLQTAAKLGMAVISAFQDAATVATTLHYDRLPYFDFVKEWGKRTLSSGQRDFLQSHGIISQHLSGALDRFTSDTIGNGITSRLSNAVMKVSLHNAWIDGWRSAFSATMMKTFAGKLGADWQGLDEWDRWLMGNKGIDEAAWNTISQAKPTYRNGIGYLTRDGILATNAQNAEQIADQWMAFVSDESQFAVVHTDLSTRALSSLGGMPVGTLRGEAARCMTQFKSFPMAMITRHWGRIFDTPQGLQGAPTGYGATGARSARINQMAVLSGLAVSSMMLGAIALQTKAVLMGKDPFDMTMPKFWIRSLGQGGGLGYVGDLVSKDPTQQDFSHEQTVGSMFGPVAGTVAGVTMDLGLSNAWKAAEGKKTNVAAETLRQINANLPGTNLWETRALWEHWFLNNAQEAVNPGYLSRMQQRAKQDWEQDYYWAPGTALPQRAPNAARAVGQ